MHIVYTWLEAKQRAKEKPKLKIEESRKHKNEVIWVFYFQVKGARVCCTRTYDWKLKIVLNKKKR